MLQFADRTGLTSDRPPDRYLWTDAFAVCCFRPWADGSRACPGDTGSSHARRVPRRRSSSRLDQRLEGDAAGTHPTSGGLRIGKELPERAPGEALDESLEWDRDGQYFHYLTTWMHALDQVTRWSGDPTFNIWARELAEAAHRAFTHMPDGAASSDRRRMHWKMSVDLSRPLVASTGHHDPLDGTSPACSSKRPHPHLAPLSF